MASLTGIISLVSTTTHVPTAFYRNPGSLKRGWNIGGNSQHDKICHGELRRMEKRPQDLLPDVRPTRWRTVGAIAVVVVVVFVVSGQRHNSLTARWFLFFHTGISASVSSITNVGATYVRPGSRTTGSRPRARSSSRSSRAAVSFGGGRDVGVGSGFLVVSANDPEVELFGCAAEKFKGHD